MRRRINLKFLGIVLAAGAVFATGAHFLHGFQVRSNSSVLLAQADKAKEEGKLQESANYLTRYLALVPKDNDALARYSLLLADEKLAKTPRALLKAFFVLDQVVRQDPAREDIRRRVVQVAMHPWLQRYKDAQAHLAKLPDNDAELQVLRARCHEAAGEYKQARKCLEKAIALRPQEMSSYIALAYLLRRNAAKVKEGEKTTAEVIALADASMLAMVKANERSFQAHLSLARYRKEFSQLASSEEAAAVEAEVRKAQELAPTEADVILAVAELADEKTRPEEARASLRKGLELYPADWRMYQALARLEVGQGRTEEALTGLRQGLKKLPKQIDLLWNLAYLLIQTDHKDEAGEAIKRLQAEGFPKPDLDYLSARSLLAEEKWLDASRLLEHAYPLLMNRNNQFKDWFSLNLAQESSLLLGQCYEQMGDGERAAIAFSRVVSRDPRSIPGRLGLARMRWAMNRLDVAADEYRQILTFAKAPAVAWIELAQLLIVQNYRTAQPDWTEVTAVLDQASKFVPPLVEVAVLRAEVQVAQKDFTQARKVLEEGHADKQARPAQVWTSLAAVEERQGNGATALALLDQAQKYLGDRVELRLARARYWSRHKGDPAKKALADLAQQLERFKPAEQRSLFKELAVAYQELGEASEAERLWEKLAEAQPKTWARITLFDFALRAGDDARMHRLVEAIKKGIEGDDGTLWRYGRACELILRAERGDKRGLAEASDLLSTVATRRPGWARVPLCQGQVQDLLGNGDAAVAKYQQAVLLGERSSAVFRRGIALLLEQRRYAEADQMLKKLQEQQTGPLGDLDRVAAEIALRKQDTALALRLAQKAVARDAKDYRDHLWQAQMFWAAGQPAEAEAAFRRALTLAGDAPAPYVAYVQYLVRTGSKDKAEAMVREVETKLPRDKATLALAECYQLLGLKDRAKDLYQAALVSHPEDVEVLRGTAVYYLGQNDAKKAAEYLKRITDLKSASTEQKRQARIALAFVIASGGDYRQSRKGLEILGIANEVETKDAAAGMKSIEEKRACALLLAVQPSHQKRKQAIGILEGLAGRKLLQPGDQFMLIQLYEATGDWPKARAQMMTLLTATEEKLEEGALPKGLGETYRLYLAHACESLLGHNQLDDARLWLAKLEKLEPDTFRTVSLKARVLAKQGQGQEAVAPIQSLAKTDDKLLRPAAALLEQIGQKAAAQAMYEKFVAQSKHPEDVLVLAQFFGRQNLAENGLALCEKAWQTSKPEAVAEAAMAILYTAKPSAPQEQRVIGWLEDAIAKHPEKTILLDRLAAVRRLQGRYEDTIALYRRILQSEPGNSVALNNLAWLLALKEGNGTEALQAIQQAIDFGGPTPAKLDTRAIAYLALGKSQPAIKDLEEAIAQQPRASWYFHLARAYHQARDRSAAARAWAEARRLGLSEQTIDPLEQPAYRQLAADLDRK